MASSTKRGDDLLTRMARSGIEMQERLSQRVEDVTGDPKMGPEDMVDLYLQANFEQRTMLFQEVFGAHGADGLELLRDVLELATKRVQGETF